MNQLVLSDVLLVLFYSIKDILVPKFLAMEIRVSKNLKITFESDDFDYSVLAYRWFP